MTDNINKFFRRPLNIFYLFSLSCIILFFVCACFHRSETLFNWLIVGGNPNWELSDFFRQIGYSSDLKNVYYSSGGGSDAPMPALTYIFFHFLYIINPVKADIPTWLLKGYTIDYEPVIFVMWTILQVLLFVYFIKKITNFSTGEAVFFTIILMFSSPYFSAAIERGNPILFTVLLLCAALYLREGNNLWQKELALILIACAAGFKVLPCCMGLLYIRERRWSEAVRLIIWGVILVLLPFAFTGGWASFVEFVKIISQHGRIQSIYWSSFSGFARYWLHVLTGVHSHRNEAIFQIVVQFIFCLTMIYFTFFTKHKWKAVFYLSMIMAYSHSNSYRYYTIYLTLPLLLMIAETKDNVIKTFGDVIYYIFFAAIFTIQIWGGDIEHWICGTAYLLCLYSIFDDIFIYFYECKPNNNNLTLQR